MSRLEEDKANSTSQIADAQAETEKREERLRAMATKVGLKQFFVQLILSKFGWNQIGKIDKSCSELIEIISAFCRLLLWKRRCRGASPRPRWTLIRPRLTSRQWKRG